MEFEEAVNVLNISDVVDKVNSSSNASVSGAVTTRKYDTIYLADDSSLERLPAFIAANYLDYIYAPLCASVGLVGSVLAFLVLVNARSTSTTYVYMASLCVSDSLVQVVNLLFMVRKFPGHETLKEGTCGLVFFLLYFSIHYNVVVMVTMTVERYLAISFPLKAPAWFTLPRARLVVILQALFVFGLDAQHLILRGMVFDRDAGQHLCMPLGERTAFYLYKVWPWVDGVIYCYAPLACLVLFNLLILSKIRSSRSFLTEPEKSQRKMSDKEAQVTRMLLLVTTAFLLLVSPMAVIIVVERYYWSPRSPAQKAAYHLVRTIFNNLDYTNHALNFLLYCFSGQRFRRELRQTFSCLCRGKGVHGTSSAGGKESSGHNSRDASAISTSLSTMAVQ